jgi:hypothetical protein
VSRSLAIFLSLSFLSMAFLGLALGLLYQITPEHKRLKTFRWILIWGTKGFILPLLVWSLMNLGLAWDLQPFMPRVQRAQMAGGPWIVEFLRAAAQGMFILSSYWSALTLGWVLVAIWQELEGEALSDFKMLCLISTVGMLLPAALVFWLGGWKVTGLAALAIVTPIAGYSPSIAAKKKIPPMYAKAVAKMKFGKYGEAEWDIIGELEKHEDDFDGWMMLADLYANQFKDLHEAEATILEICDQPRTTPSQLSVALHRLADWHLNLGGDPDAARRALQMIADRMPNTHLARMAELRSQQLPETAQDLQETKIKEPIRLPALGDSLDAEAPPEPTMERHEAARQANDCVEKLQRDPNNIPAREKLARLFTEQLAKPELGIEQLSLLLDMPGQRDLKRAEWLGLTAAWHLRHRQDPENARRILERVVAEFPNTPQALAARRRIQLIETDSLRAKA